MTDRAAELSEPAGAASRRGQAHPEGSSEPERAPGERLQRHCSERGTGGLSNGYRNDGDHTLISPPPDFRQQVKAKVKEEDQDAKGLIRRVVGGSLGSGGSAEVSTWLSRSNTALAAEAGGSTGNAAPVANKGAKTKMRTRLEQCLALASVVGWRSRSALSVNELGKGGPAATSDTGTGRGGAFRAQVMFESDSADTDSAASSRYSSAAARRRAAALQEQRRQRRRNELVSKTNYQAADGTDRGGVRSGELAGRSAGELSPCRVTTDEPSGKQHWDYSFCVDRVKDSKVDKRVK